VITMAEYLSQDSPFITEDTRQKRWAVPYHYEATNARADVLLGKNVEYVKGKRVLELGCYFGTWMKVCQDLGASFVEGVDSSQDLVDQGERLFQAKSKESYRFHVAEVIEYLESQPENSVDTILCFGLLYYLPDPYHAIKLMKKVAKKAIILDTFTAYYVVIQGKDYENVVKKVTDETFDLPLLFYSRTQAKKKNQYELPNSFKGPQKELSLLTCPTRPLLELWFQSLGLIITKIDWSEILVNSEKLWNALIPSGGKTAAHWSDIYSTDVRVSYLLKV
jgi:SAM-dependent methyltransferase